MKTEKGISASEGSKMRPGGKIYHSNVLCVLRTFICLNLSEILSCNRTFNFKSLLSLIALINTVQKLILYLQPQSGSTNENWKAMIAQIVEFISAQTVLMSFGLFKDRHFNIIQYNDHAYNYDH